MSLEIDSLFNSFNKSNILVVGDSMIDSYVWGKIDRMSPGDTVISVAALCLSQNTSIELLGFLSNLAGGIVCECSGVVKLDKEKLYKEAISHYNKS